MSKKENRQLIATPRLRQLFSDLTAARQHRKEWERHEELVKGAVRAESDLLDVTYMTEAGAEVGSITETDPSTPMDWEAFRTAHPELETEFAKFRKPATTQVRVLTTWVEPAQSAD